MRVRRTRVLDECSVDNPSACRDVGCCAIRWDLTTREGAIVDLFKSVGRERAGCDLSIDRASGGAMMVWLVCEGAPSFTAVRGTRRSQWAAQQRPVWSTRSPKGGPQSTVNHRRTQYGGAGVACCGWKRDWSFTAPRGTWRIW